MRDPSTRKILEVGRIAIDIRVEVQTIDEGSTFSKVWSPVMILPTMVPGKAVSHMTSEDASKYVTQEIRDSIVEMLNGGYDTE